MFGCVFNMGVKFIGSSEYLLRRKELAVFHQPTANICKELCFIPSCCMKEFRSSSVGSVGMCPKYQKKNPLLQTLKPVNAMVCVGRQGTWCTDFIYLYHHFLVLGAPIFFKYIYSHILPLFPSTKTSGIRCYPVPKAPQIPRNTEKN